MTENIEIPLHSIKLPGDSDFAHRFNAVSDLFIKAMDESLPQEEQDEAWQEFCARKYCLEMGIG